jgi:hypothetical protein
MDWINENKSSATLMGVLAVAAAGLAFLVFNAYSGYSTAMESYGVINNTLARMKSADLYPSPENEKRKADAVAAYEEKVTTLSRVLLNLQPKAEPISETDFQAKLKARIAEIKTLAGKATTLPGDFALGFNEYTASLPSSAEVARELSDYLDAVEGIMRLAIESGVQSVDSLERSELNIEKGVSSQPPAAPAARNAVPGAKPAKEVAKMVERRTVTLTMTTDQAPLQMVLNQLASPSKMPHFTAVRLLRIENEVNEGPAKAMVAQTLNRQTAPLISEDGGDSEAVVITADGQATAAPKEEEITAAKPGRKDAIGVLGQEKIKVYMEIDVIKFMDAEKAPEAS